MPCQKFLLGYKNVALIAPRVGERYFVEDHNSILRVPLHVIQLEVGMDGLPPWTSLNQAVYGRGHLQEGHPVLILRKYRQWVLYWLGLSFPAVLHMELGGHVFHVQLRSTLPLHQVLTLLHMVGVSLSSHLPPIGCSIFLPGDGPRLKHHYHHIFHFSYDTKPLKYAN